MGARFEAYGGSILAGLKSARRVIRGAELHRRVGGKNCDFLVELEDCIAVFEFKAAVLSARILIPEVLRKDNSTRKIQDGVMQIQSTASKLRRGNLDVLAIDRAKPILGFVVVYGHIPFPNAPWYAKEIIEADLERKLERARIKPGPLAHPPIVLTSRTFELLVTALDAKMNLRDLIEEKTSVPYESVGDWLEFLKGKLKEHLPEHLPSFVDDVFRDYFAALGASAPSESE